MPKNKIIATTNQQLQNYKELGIDIGLVSDGFHNFTELYEHRCILYLALTAQMLELHKLDHLNSYKSLKHHDETSYEGWFITGFKTNFGWISYHLPMKHWHSCRLPEWELAPIWDGHTPNDVLERLLSLI
jgi:hypothetical protein